MSGIFISYRRQGTGGWSRSLANELDEKLRKDEIFFDVDSMHAGFDFRETIEEYLDRSDVVLVVIGREWASVNDADGTRRIDDPADHVRREIEMAIEKKKLVIPVLVDNATMPSQEELPESLQTLAVRHAMPVREIGYQSDVDRLVEQIGASRAEAAKRSAATAAETGDGASANTKGLAIGAAIAVIAVIAVIAAIALSLGGGDSGNDTVADAEQADPQEEAADEDDQETAAADDEVDQPETADEEVAAGEENEQQEPAPTAQAEATVPSIVSLDEADNVGNEDVFVLVRLVSEESQQLDNCLAGDENEAPVMLPCSGDSSDLWFVWDYQPDAPNPYFGLGKEEAGSQEQDLWLCLDEDGDVLVADCWADDPTDDARSFLSARMTEGGYFTFGPFNDTTLCAAHPPGGEGLLGVEPCSGEPRFHWALVPET